MTSKEAVDEILKSWRQGDCVLGEQKFFHRANINLRLTPQSECLPANADLAEYAVKGLVVLTQTCDLVRSCSERPYLEVAPLMEVTDEGMNEVAKARRPQFAYLPNLAPQRLVADLDRVMTVEKAACLEWVRTEGLSTDQQARDFASALARKRQRMAFPDDFSALCRRLSKKLQAKHNARSPEGVALRELREIRVLARPSWLESPTSLWFWFVREGNSSGAGVPWDEFLERWLELLPPNDRFTSIEGVVVTLEDMTAMEYVDSDRLDLDHLSLTPDE